MTGGALLSDTGTPVSDTVVGFTAGVDHLSFAGENPRAIAQVVASAQTTGGNTVLSLADHSIITLVGITHVYAGFFG